MRQKSYCSPQERTESGLKTKRKWPKSSFHTRNYESVVVFGTKCFKA